VHARAGVLSVIFVISYLAMGAPAIAAGFRVVATQDLLGTARELAVLVGALSLAALVGGLRGKSQRASGTWGRSKDTSGGRSRLGSDTNVRLAGNERSPIFRELVEAEHELVHAQFVVGAEAQRLHDIALRQAGGRKAHREVASERRVDIGNRLRVQRDLEEGTDFAR
jgi:hypothetical protein